MNWKKKILLGSIGCLLLSMLVILIIDKAWHDTFIGFLEHYVSSDGRIESAGTFEFYFLVYARFILIWGMGALLLCFPYKKLLPILNKIRTDKLMITSYLLSIFSLVLWLLLRDGRYQRIYIEGWAERLSELVLFIISILLFLYAAKRKQPNIGKQICYLLAFIFLVLFFEEISWGQQIFHWHTPTFFSSINIQNETNFHNLFNKHFALIYITFDVVMAAIFLNLDWLRSKRKNLPACLIPNNKFTIYGFIFLLLGVFVFLDMNLVSEICEEVFAIVALTLVLKIWQGTTGEGHDTSHIFTVG